jgi:hypothetical protein
MSESFDPQETNPALELDRAIDALASGEDAAGLDAETRAVVQALLVARRTAPPASLQRRVRAAVREAAHERAWLPVRLAAAVLGLAFLAQGAGSLLFGSWVAGGLHIAFEPHLLFESGVALLALGGVVLAGAFSRRLLDVALAAGAPVGLVFAVHGLPELVEFPAGGALHLSQGIAALVFAVLWSNARRYVSRRPAK